MVREGEIGTRRLVLCVTTVAFLSNGDFNRDSFAFVELGIAIRIG